MSRWWSVTFLKNHLSDFDTDIPSRVLNVFAASSIVAARKARDLFVDSYPDDCIYYTSVAPVPLNSHGGSRSGSGSVPKYAEKTKVVRLPESLATKHFDKVVAIPELLDILEDYRAEVLADNLRVSQGLKNSPNPRLDGARRLLADLTALGY